jgi:hypothetical protein
MTTKKDLVIAILATFCLTLTLFVVIPTRSASTAYVPGPYNPWADIDDDGRISLYDAVILLYSYGSQGTPINKTALLYNVNDTFTALLSRIADLETQLIILNASKLGKPDYDSGWMNLLKATAYYSGLFIDHVNPTSTTLNHNLGTYDILVYVLAGDGTGRYVQIPSVVYPSTLVGGGLFGQTQWFLTSQNQIMLENWDYNRAVPVHVMIWKIPQ